MIIFLMLSIIFSMKRGENGSLEIQDPKVTKYLLYICLRSIPRDPDVVCPLVRSNVENSDQMTK